MSTYWHFECMDHTPPIQSREFTQHTDNDAYKAGIELANNRPVSSEGPLTGNGSRDYFDRNARGFLLEHPACHLEVVSESGDRWPL